MKQQQYRVDNGAGWKLDVRRFYDPDNLDAKRRPVVAVPGFCMNCFILNYHPGETPMIEYLVDSGLEVWAANLRGQGDSTRQRGSTRYGFSDLAVVDLPAVVDFVADHTRSEAGDIDLIGCSLGATVGYAYLAHHHDRHRIGALVSIGGPLRWNRTHPLLRLAVQCPRLLGAVPVRGTRQMARLAMPLAKYAPWLVSHYVNTDIVDLSEADKLVQTIDDPNPRLTREMARWIRDKDLIVDGLNISHAMYSIDIPIQCVIAMQDGVVTPESALSILDHIGSHNVDIVEVGSPETPHAHADLFVSDGVGDKVFRPIRDWLASLSV